MTIGKENVLHENGKACTFSRLWMRWPGRGRGRGKRVKWLIKGFEKGKTDIMKGVLCAHTY